MFDQETLDWMLLLGRWLHVAVAISWIGTSVFFMWLDRTFVPNPDSKREGHLGDLWMVHGGGFYQVEKMLMGPTKVPELLHWFKWESYWTWMSGFFLLVLTYYTGSGTYLLDSGVSDLNFQTGLGLALFSLFGSFFFYDFVWERKFTRESPLIGHFLTLIWFVGMTYLLCHTLSGRAAYIHIGGMLGTWMAGNVFLRIIPRQVKMVEATKNGKPVNPDWGKNAKNRSTHNTYFALPVVFIMISNHFPATYGHELNWLVLLLLTLAGALIREYFIIRISQGSRAKILVSIGCVLILGTILMTRQPEIGGIFNKSEIVVENADHIDSDGHTKVVKDLKTEHTLEAVVATTRDKGSKATVKGLIHFNGKAKRGMKLRLPRGCVSENNGPVYSDEVIVNHGKISNVLVRISKGLEGKIYNEIPLEEVELNQKGCLYSPRVIAARVNQTVTFINSDKLYHNVKSVTKNNPKFNFSMPKYNQKISRKFQSPELLMQTKCSVHPWMKASIAIFDHPFYDVTRENGSFEIKDLPLGEYTIEIWHEVYGTQTKKISLTTEKTIELDFTIESK